MGANDPVGVLPGAAADGPAVALARLVASRLHSAVVTVDDVVHAPIVVIGEADVQAVAGRATRWAPWTLLPPGCELMIIASPPPAFALSA